LLVNPGLTHRSGKWLALRFLITRRADKLGDDVANELARVFNDRRESFRAWSMRRTVRPAGVERAEFRTFRGELRAGLAELRAELAQDGDPAHEAHCSVSGSLSPPTTAGLVLALKLLP